MRPTLTLDIARLAPLTLDATQIAKVAEMAPVVAGKPDPTKIRTIDLEQLGRERRMQRIVLASDRIAVVPPSFGTDELKRRIMLTLSMTRIVQHVGEALRFQNAERLEPVFDPERPIRSTGDMRLSARLDRIRPWVRRLADADLPDWRSFREALSESRQG